MKRNNFYIQQDSIALYSRNCSFLNFWVIDSCKKILFANDKEYFDYQNDHYSDNNPEFIEAINWLLAN